ncbi:MAG: MFS transporter [Dehalococcoidia bacterium]
MDTNNPHTSVSNVRRNIPLIAVLNFCTDFILYGPVAILYFSRVAGSYALGMSIFSGTMLSAAAFQIPTGVFSDLYGRKRTVVLGAVCASAAAVSYAIGGAYLVLLIGSLFAGLARSLYSGNNEALLYATLAQEGKESDFHHYLGKTGSLFQVALAVSAVLGGFLAGKSFALVMWLSVIPQVLGFCVSLWLIEPDRKATGSAHGTNVLGKALLQFRRNRRLRLLTISSVLRYSFGEASYQFRAAFVRTLWPLWAIGLSAGLGNALAAASFYFAGKVITRLTALRVLSLDTVLPRAVNVAMLAFPTVASPAVMAATGLTYGVSTVAEGSLLQREFTEGERATLGSLNSLAGSVAFSIFAIGLGAVGDRIGPAKTLILVQIVLVIPIFLYRRIFVHAGSPEDMTSR